MKTPHKHAELIKAWADGAEIQFRHNVNNPWDDVKGVCGWGIACEYRIKPEPKSDFCMEYFVTQKGVTQTFSFQKSPVRNNLKLTFDGETGELKAAEVL